MAYQPYEEKYVSTVGEDGLTYFSVDGHRIPHVDEVAGGDCYQLDQGYITVTPVQMLANDVKTLNKLKEAKFEL